MLTYQQMPVTQFKLLDVEGSDHCRLLTSVIGMFTEIPVLITPVETSMLKGKILELLKQVRDTCYTSDVVLIPWQIPRDEEVNSIISEISIKCFVVTAAGNTSDNIENFSPSSVPSVITVGALNKSGIPAKFSSRSLIREIKWAPGTNIMVDGEPRSGTSVAAAIYAGFLANAIAAGDLSLVDSEIDRIKGMFYNELNS